MVKVVAKIFSILELIAQNAPNPSSPQELAEALGIHRTTCSRLLRILLDSGYIIRYSRVRGYLPGPKILTLSNRAAFQADLLEKARPIIDRCAKELQNSVLLSQVYDGKRYVLYHKNGNAYLPIVLRELSCNDLFCTATGLLILSHLPEAQQCKLHREQKKLGAEFLESTRNLSDAVELLQKIRKDDFFACEKCENQWIYAFPVYDGKTFAAALGVSIPRNEYTAVYHKKICRVMKEASNELSALLSARILLG